MDRRTEAGESREGLLRSYDKDFSSKGKDSEDGRRYSEESDIDATDYLTSELHDPSHEPVPAYGTGKQLAGLRRSLARRSKCLLITLPVLIILWSILASGGVLLYKKAPSDGQSPPWYPTPVGGTLEQWKESYEKASKLVNQMTLIEKVNITTGTGWQMGLAVGNTAPANNVGFPGLALQDGPLGLRFADNATAFPAGITVGATWNKELMYKRGKAHGQEARLKGINVLLGPCVGPLGRMPAGGRNWEGFGTDPYLQGVAAAQTIKGIQQEGVIAVSLPFDSAYRDRAGVIEAILGFYNESITDSQFRLSSTSLATNRNISGKASNGVCRMQCLPTWMIGKRHTPSELQHCLLLNQNSSRTLWLAFCRQCKSRSSKRHVQLSNAQQLLFLWQFETPKRHSEGRTWLPRICSIRLASSKVGCCKCIIRIRCYDARGRFEMGRWVLFMGSSIDQSCSKRFTAGAEA